MSLSCPQCGRDYDSHKELIGQVVEHPKHGKGKTYADEKLYPQLLVDIFDDDSTGTPVINPKKMDENDWKIISKDSEGLK